MSSALVADAGSGLSSKLDGILDGVRRHHGVVVDELPAVDANTLLSAYYRRTNQTYLIEENAAAHVTEPASSVFWVARDASRAQRGVISTASSTSEISRLCSGAGIAVPDAQGYAEVKRFVTFGDAPNPGVPLGLMAAATRWCVRKEFRGIMALTRSIQARFFARFGLSSYVASSFNIPERQDAEYWLLHAEWATIERAADHCLRNMECVPW
jgi:hypothetical protein